MATWRGGRWGTASTAAWRCFDHVAIKPESPLEGTIPLKSVTLLPSHKQEPCAGIKVAREFLRIARELDPEQSIQRNSQFRCVSSTMIPSICIRLLYALIEHSLPSKKFPMPSSLFRGARFPPSANEGKSICRAACAK